MAHPPASAPSAPSKKSKCTPSTSAIPKPTTKTSRKAAAPRLSPPSTSRASPPSGRSTAASQPPASRAAWASARGLDVAKWTRRWKPAGTMQKTSAKPPPSPEPSSDPVTVLPPSLVPIPKPSLTLGAIPARIAAPAPRSTPAHEGLQASFGGVSGSGDLDSELNAADVTALGGDTARATAAPPAANVNDFATVDA
ncbi:hypothetical protein DFP72DRAFT_1079339 [Ephemerocybe angulata]|uniref:Uncharacterized protein n=1 Tax=Ephemerocybe angulata TaxID=980116 RepID=A0A8H6HBJ3_9AGAR|nr:hypothetical protein DFP72DRAFT_1079339 [Tulosesus angulatus]